ncbi:mechanosensitive ion channel family protein [Desulfogranum japonicum]|uniref:mechanosensitive ion channel family protein n=1 Tax=Desulfogranum japonicum TaxID=231447 RepID=UPI001377F702|nr:mechanosensitive ion channel family protein [Desulfogranum japonicum]
MSFSTMLFFLVVSWYTAKLAHTFLIRKYISKGNSSSNAVSGLIKGVLYGSCILLGLGLFLRQQGYSFTGVWISTGMATALLGFALQQTLGDFFSGIAMGLEGGVRIGDWIKLEDGRQGVVIDINWRSFWLHDWDNTTHIIPNSKLAKQGFNNLGDEYTYFNPWYSIKLPQEIEPRFAKQLLLEGIYRCKHVLKHPPPVVRLEDASTIPYTYMCWVYFPNYPAMFRGRDELFSEIHHVLQQAGVSPSAVTHEYRLRKAEIPVAEPPTIQLALKSQKIFAQLPDDEIEALANVSNQVHYEAGSEIQYEDAPDSFDIITSGVVEVSMDLYSGRRVVTGELGPGDSYGLVSMFSEQPITTIWVAQTDVTLIRIDMESMKSLMQKHPSLTDRIAAVVKQRQDEAELMNKQEYNEAGQSSIQEIKRYIRYMLKRKTKSR